MDCKDISLRISILAKMGTRIIQGLDNGSYDAIIEEAYQKNPWFSPGYIRMSLCHIAKNYLSEEKIHQWLQRYEIGAPAGPRSIALNMAGNIPLVGFHDLVCTFICGYKSLIRCSSKDNTLLPFLIAEAISSDPACAPYFSFTERLSGCDAIIATGSNNSARYFEYYFRNIPHLIRKNKSSMAILTGKESAQDMQGLAKDVFTYFGLGCRNVTQILIPDISFLDALYEPFSQYKTLIEHHKYANNYLYYRSLYLMNTIRFFDTGFALFVNNSQVSSPVSVIHYTIYPHLDFVGSYIERNTEEIQIVIAASELDFPCLKPGTSQYPELSDYADNTDTMAFLLAFDYK
jgi:hypothetical protein